MLHCHMAQSLPVGLAQFLLVGKVAQSLPMGLCFSFGIESYAMGWWRVER
jgi:hypothetical protein